ncbi:hypothetical protein AURDEDRAFT_177441 [Auricularia subglabra TFB-10046 SS5]|uniref:F-box domain-containing protein n=1 Tax=Auricularia subglabra (strain TFB-10046 / SS5) TaxID=717982 RepID=J0WNS0_AURST|nr:hypothetical protein AURDEDRAFT_177441 [Auricularia subglabra TFB-10046 SS5]
MTGRGLPREMWDEIVDRVESSADLASLATTNSGFYSVAMPRLYKTVVVRTPRGRCALALILLSKPIEFFVKHVRHFAILNPARDPKKECPWKLVDDLRRDNTLPKLARALSAVRSLFAHPSILRILFSRPEFTPTSLRHVSSERGNYNVAPESEFARAAWLRAFASVTRFVVHEWCTATWALAALVANSSSSLREVVLISRYPSSFRAARFEEMDLLTCDLLELRTLSFMLHVVTGLSSDAVRHCHLFTVLARHRDARLHMAAIPARLDGPEESWTDDAVDWYATFAPVPTYDVDG